MSVIRRLEREKGATFREIVNDALRRGLAQTPPKEKEPSRTRVVSLGVPKIKNVDDIQEVLAMMDADE